MDYSIPKLAAGLAAIAILTLVYAHQWALFRRRHLAWWALGWACYLARYGLMFGMPPHQTFAPVVVVYASLAVAGSWLLWRGTLAFLARPAPAWPSWVLLVSYLWVFAAKLAGLPNWLASGPCSLAVAGMYLANGLLLWRAADLEVWTRRMTFMAFGFWALLQSVYPVTVYSHRLAAWGFLLAGAMEVWAAVGLLLLNFLAGRRELLLAQAQLADGEDRLRRVLVNMPVMLYAFDGRGALLEWNAECERLTGYARAELTGEPGLARRLLADDPEGERWRQWSNPGTQFRDRQWEITCKDGSRRMIAFSSLAGRVPVAGWAAWGVGADVSARQRAQAALQRLAAGVAHNFNNTLMAMSASLEAATHELGGREARAAGLLEGALMGARQGRTVVKRLLSLVGERRGDLEELPAQDLGLVAEHSLSVARAAWGHLGADSAGVALRAPRGILVRGEYHELVEVVLAMVRRVLEHSPPGLARLELVCELHQGPAGRVARLMVRDPESGARQGRAAEIPAPFYAAGAASTADLGLTVARGVARSLGGELELEQGTGATLRLTLPAASATEAAVPDEPPRLDGVRALLVEDETLVAMGTQALLATVGCASDIAPSLARAYRMLDETAYDLVICDLGLNDGTGWELAESLAARRDRGRPAPPVILLTGWAAAQVVNQPEARPGLVWGVLHKPVERGELFWAAAQAVAGAAASAALAGQEIVDEAAGDGISLWDLG